MAEALAAEDTRDWAGQDERDTPAARDEVSPHLRVAGYEGPLDFLLEMVRRQRVDLGPLSILTLTDQLVDAIEDSGGTIRLERRADWLVMASQLLLLKAQLLVPASPEAAEAAGEEARRRLGQLDELARMRAAAAWLSARPQLGREVFPRGQGAPPTPRPQAELYVALLEATLTMLEDRKGQGAEPLQTYRPTPPDLWRVAEAAQRITALLAEQPHDLSLENCMPVLDAKTPDRPLRLRAALASTFVAGLELAREGTLTLEQRQPFGSITVAPPRA